MGLGLSVCLRPLCVVKRPAGLLVSGAEAGPSGREVQALFTAVGRPPAGHQLTPMVALTEIYTGQQPAASPAHLQLAGWLTC